VDKVMDINDSDMLIKMDEETTKSNHVGTMSPHILFPEQCYPPTHRSITRN